MVVAQRRVESLEGYDSRAITEILPLRSMYRKLDLIKVSMPWLERAASIMSASTNRA
jgi:hypothetical protein